MRTRILIDGEHYKTEAIVLRKMRYGEADSILHLYTREHGRVGAIAKGVRRSRSASAAVSSRSSGSSWCCTRAAATWRRSPPPRRSTATRSLRTRADSIDAAAKTGDFVLRLLDDRERNEPAYNLLANMLGLLDADPSASRLEVLAGFRAKLLLAAGFSPELGGCVQCGAQDSE